mmetsp:Transcript_62238/g.190111  ORF Transcript_62238/g.190111 Transcript_62238/m.190111 type:complete len:242 (+) Transcript_62238:560-1285(+)
MGTPTKAKKATKITCASFATVRTLTMPAVLKVLTAKYKAVTKSLSSANIENNTPTASQAMRACTDTATFRCSLVKRRSCWRGPSVCLSISVRSLIESRPFWNWGKSSYARLSSWVAKRIRLAGPAALYSSTCLAAIAGSLSTLRIMELAYCVYLTMRARSSSNLKPLYPSAWIWALASARRASSLDWKDADRVRASCAKRASAPLTTEDPTMMWKMLYTWLAVVLSASNPNPMDSPVCTEK